MSIGNNHKKDCNCGFCNCMRTEEHYKKVVATRRNYKHSEETKKKIGKMFKGKKISEEHRLKIVEALKRRIRKPETIEKIRQSNLGKKHSIETRKKLSLANKRRFKNKENHPMFNKKHSEETKRKMSLSHKGKSSRLGIKHSEETKKRLSKIKKKLFREGKLIPYFKGKQLSDEHKRKISLSKKNQIAWNKGLKGEEYLKHYKNGINTWNKGLTKETNEELKKISKKLKGRIAWNRGIPNSEEKRMKISKANKGKKKNLSLERRKVLAERLKKIGLKRKGKPNPNHSKIMKELWQNKEYRERTIKKMLKGLMKRPTSLEKQMISIIKKHNLPYKYVGDGSFLIGYKNPDFINTNGEKILIEVANTFHHKQDYPKKRSEYFDKYGWKSIIFLTNDLNEKEVLKNFL